LSCNRPPKTTTNILFIIRNCCKFSFTFKVSGIYQPVKSCPNGELCIWFVRISDGRPFRKGCGGKKKGREDTDFWTLISKYVCSELWTQKYYNLFDCWSCKKEDIVRITFTGYHHPFFQHTHIHMYTICHKPF